MALLSAGEISALRHSQNIRAPKPVERCEVSTLAMKLSEAYAKHKAARENASEAAE